MDKEREQDLPVILPIVLYQGKQKWENPKTIHELIGGEKVLYPVLRQYVPHFKFLFYNFSRYGKIDIKGTMKLRAYLQVIKHLYGEDNEPIYSIIVQLERAGEMNLFESIILYLVNVTDSFSIDTLKERLTMEGRNKIMTIAEQWSREGEKKGMRRGEKKVLSRLQKE